MQDIMFPEFQSTAIENCQYEDLIEHEKQNKVHDFYLSQSCDKCKWNETLSLNNNDVHYATHCHPDVLKYVINKNQGLCKLENDQGMTPLHYALFKSTYYYHPYLLENIILLIQVEKKLGNTFFPRHYRNLENVKQHDYDQQQRYDDQQQRYDDMNDSLYNSDHYQTESEDESENKIQDEFYFIGSARAIGVTGAPGATGLPGSTGSTGSTGGTGTTVEKKVEEKVEPTENIVEQQTSEQNEASRFDRLFVEDLNEMMQMWESIDSQKESISSSEDEYSKGGLEIPRHTINSPVSKAKNQTNVDIESENKIENKAEKSPDSSIPFISWERHGIVHKFDDDNMILMDGPSKHWTNQLALDLMCPIEKTDLVKCIKTIMDDTLVPFDELFDVKEKLPLLNLSMISKIEKYCQHQKIYIHFNSSFASPKFMKMRIP